VATTQPSKTELQAQEGHESLRAEPLLVELVQAVALAASGSESTEQAMQLCLDEICTRTGWPLGHVWVALEGSQELVSAHIWHHHSDNDIRGFKNVTESITLTPGEGLPGRVLATRRPEWVGDLSVERSFPRSPSARTAGIKAGIAFPAQVGEQVVAVLEFFSPHLAEPDNGLLNALAHVGTLFGRLVERKRAEEEARESEMLKRAVVESALDCVIIADHKGRILDFNPAAERTFGYERSQVIGKDVAECVVPPSLRDRHRKGMARYLLTGESRVAGRRIEVTAMRSDGSEFPVELAIQPIPQGGRPAFAAYIRDITTRKMMQNRLEHEAFHDSLTNLANRKLFMERLEHALARTDRRKEPQSLIYLDLDNFKDVNDSLGHVRGDELLMEVARRLRKRLRPGDTLARLGGDEFAVLLEDTNESGAERVAGRFMEGFDRPLRLDEEEVSVRASVGIATGTAGETPADELLRRADEAMYGDKGKRKQEQASSE
jgi:diguanylate cyclase (GGDEF)-like protein/PAS domain S-box-containing protein